MNSLPNQSEATIKEGIWFVFQDGIDIIRVHGSMLTGKEFIYFNDEVISKSSRFKKENEHRFRIGENSYVISLKTQSRLSGPIECRLIKNEVYQKGFSCAYLVGEKANSTLKVHLNLLSCNQFAPLTPNTLKFTFP